MILSTVTIGVTVHGRSGMVSGIVMLLIHGMSSAVGNSIVKSVIKKQKGMGVPPPTPPPTGMYVPSNNRGLGLRLDTRTTPKENFEIFSFFER